MGTETRLIPVGSSGFPIRLIHVHEFRRRDLTQSVLDRSIRKCLKKAGWAKTMFLRLVWGVRSRSALLRPRAGGGRIDVRGLTRIVGGLLNLALHCKDWRRVPEEWRPPDDNAIPLFSSLAHHLLADYPVPPVMLSCWFRGHSPEDRQQQDWFKHLGRGGSLRTAGFPIPLTKRMAHEFTQAPPRFRIEYALRWAQVLGLGGTDALAHVLARTQLGRYFYADDFWVTVIHFFINNPGIGEGDIGAIVDYLADQKFALRLVTIGDDVHVNLGPLQPDLTMKGRTPASLLRQVARWREERANPSKSRRELLTWARSSFGEYRKVEEDGTTWTIRELLDSDELVAEGQSMHHCVASYTAQCWKRSITIWSLGIEGVEDRQRVLTIELNPTTARDPAGQHGMQRIARRPVAGSSRAVGRAGRADADLLRRQRRGRLLYLVAAAGRVRMKIRSSNGARIPGAAERSSWGERSGLPRSWD